MWVKSHLKFQEETLVLFLNYTPVEDVADDNYSSYTNTYISDVSNHKLTLTFFRLILS